jgi:hypothetical protein
VLFALFYSFTGVATTWYYRALMTRSAKDAVLVGFLPIAGAAVLVYIAVKSLLEFSGSALWSMAGIAIAGVVVMIVAAAVYRSPFFLLRREAYRP